LRRRTPSAGRARASVPLAVTPAIPDLRVSAEICEVTRARNPQIPQIPQIDNSSGYAAWHALSRHVSRIGDALALDNAMVLR
jgi:hypothetical protein